MVTKKEVRALLRSGGQRANHLATAQIYDRSGERLERQTGAGLRTQVHQLLDPRLDITAAQRATGNYFGTLYEQAMGGDGKEFLREYVDSSGKVSGYSEAKAHRMNMLGCAAVALVQASPFTYPVGTARGSRLGRHAPIKAMDLAQAVCAHQKTLTQVALWAGWTRTPLTGPKKGQLIIPDRQRKHLAAALRDTLGIIASAWERGGYALPYEMTTIEVKR